MHHIFTSDLLEPENCTCYNLWKNSRPSTVYMEWALFCAFIITS